MKQRLTSFFVALFCLTSFDVYSRGIPLTDTNLELNNTSNLVNPYVMDLDPLIVISQNVNEKGLVVMSGQFNKPFTNSNILLSIKYQNAQGEWVTGWCKTLYSYNQYNENLKATFELPASVNPTYNVKVELSSDSSTSNFSSVVWNKVVSHYKQSDYSEANCDLDENEYTVLLTPKKDGTLITDVNGNVTGVKDRVTSAYYWNKLSNVLMNNKKDDVVFSPKNPATLFTDANGAKSIKMVNQGAITDTLASTPEFIYNEAAGHPIPYLYSYDDPVYMFAGKFSINGLMLKFSQWPGEPNGPGYHNFKNPNQLESRYFNLYNTIYEKLSDFIQDQEPVVIVSSLATGFRVYKSDGTHINLTGHSNYGPTYFGYTNNVARRGPGSENLIISNTSEMSLYGMGALRNNANVSYQTIRSQQDIETEIFKFIKYVGIFDDTTAYDPTECFNFCFAINSGAQPSLVTDWTKAPNSYIFDIEKDKSKKGLRIPVKKAYAMWKDNSNADFSFNNPINSTDVKAYLYWEDKAGLVISGTGYELAISGTGENAEIEVPIDITKGKGNAVISLNAFNPTANDYEVKWSWHVWVTDDPTANGSTFRQGFETRIDNTPIPNEEWKWMNRNLGATNTEFLGNDSNKSVGLMYQWGRKDPIPPLAHKDGSTYFINGKAGKYNAADFGELSYQATQKTGWILRNNIMGHENIVNNLKYSVNNPLKIITYAGWNGHDNTEYGTWFSDVEYKFFGTSEHNRVSWDLWSDNRKGLYSNGRKAKDRGASATPEDHLIEADSKSYELKSPYDPCPNGWRIPSHYAGSLGGNFGNNMSPWGRLNSGADDDLNDNSKFKYTTVNPVLSNVKVYPQIGFDFTNQNNQSDPNLNRDLGLIPITGAYVFVGPIEKVDYYLPTSKLAYINWRSTGGFPTSTYSPWHGIRGAGIVSDFLEDYSGKMLFVVNQTAMTKGANTCRCIADPNKQFIDINEAFANRYLEGNNVVADVTTLKEWSKEPNSFIAYTNTSNPEERIVKIKLKKAYAMDALYLSKDHIARTGAFKTPSVVWTSDTNLITKMEIKPGTDETAELWVTLTQNAIGNAVVAYHLGNSGQWVNGKMQDPIIWSWHIWAPRSTVSDLPAYITEEESTIAADNGMVTPNTSGHIVNPTKSGVPPMKTIFMDRDLGALEDLPKDINTPDRNTSNWKTHFAGGLHFQWGRKDPLPTFRYNGGTLLRCGTCNQAPNKIFSDPTYKVYRQVTANSDGTITTANYSAGITDVIFSSTDESTGLSREYQTYKGSGHSNIDPNDTPSEKVRKVLKYSAENPLSFLFHNRTNSEVDLGNLVYNPADSRYATQNRIVASKQVKDWLSDEREMMPERWGHNSEKSPFDPCPKGYRIPDTSMAGLFQFNKGSSPWFYNRGVSNVQNLSNYGIGQSLSYEGSTPYSLTRSATNNAVGVKNYPGYLIANTTPNSWDPNQVFFGWAFNFPGSKYNIGNIPTSGIRGDLGGNGWLEKGLGYNNTVPTFANMSGLWTSSLGDLNSGWAIAFKIYSQSASAQGVIASGTGIYPQAAMSCRCAKIEYDANGNEIGRYDPNAIAVPQDAQQKAGDTFAKEEIEKMLEDEKLSVYPNPVKDILHIDAKDDKEYYYQIYSLTGNMVKEGKFFNKQTNISSLPSGVYLIRINNSGSAVKIIKN